jgi:hypothetical protein
MDKRAIIAIGGVCGWGRTVACTTNEADAIELARTLSLEHPGKAFCQAPINDTAKVGVIE